MTKDPAFLFYSQDFLVGTLNMSLEEKGAYITLLCYQHQKGYLPANPRELSRILQIDKGHFFKIWTNIADKFHKTDSNHLVNQKLDHLVENRKKYTLKKNAAAALAGLISSHKLNKDQVEKIKQNFDIQEFIEGVDNKEVVKSKVKEWFNHMVNQSNHMVNNLENENENSNSINKEKGVIGGKTILPDLPPNNLINPEKFEGLGARGKMILFWQQKGFTVDDPQKFHVRQIERKIKLWLQAKGNHLPTHDDVYGVFEKMATSDNWHIKNNFSLETIDKNFDKIVTGIETDHQDSPETVQAQAIQAALNC